MKKKKEKIWGTDVGKNCGRGVYDSEIKMIRFFNWAVKSVKLEEVNEFSMNGETLPKLILNTQIFLKC